jgi:hypothetical protein
MTCFFYIWDLLPKHFCKYMRFYSENKVIEKRRDFKVYRNFFLIQKYIQSQSVFLKTGRKRVVSKIIFSYHKILNTLCTFRDRNYE